MLVRTGGKGPGGLSLLMVPLLNTEGVNMRRILVGGQKSAGTTFIELDDVKVPVENLVGVENQGMKYVMQNFNHERLTIAISVNRLSRVAISTAFDYCLKREAFGKTLMEQPVVRHRLAKCGAELEAHWAWIEQFVYQMTQLTEAEANAELGGLTALAKAQAGRVLDECARCAVLLFGGNGYTRSGLGEMVESKFASGECFLWTRANFRHRNISRSPWCKNSWRIRRCYARFGHTATGKELSAQDEGIGDLGLETIETSVMKDLSERMPTAWSNCTN